MKETLTKRKKTKGFKQARVRNKCWGLGLCVPWEMVVGGNSRSERGVVKEVVGVVCTYLIATATLKCP
jgi:hypothetical protein